MDALVTIAILDGKKQIGTIEKTIAIHDAVAAAIDEAPALVAGWVLSSARDKVNAEGASLTKSARKPNAKDED